jgi:hypothetical protein
VDLDILQHDRVVHRDAGYRPGVRAGRPCGILSVMAAEPDPEKLARGSRKGAPSAGEGSGALGLAIGLTNVFLYALLPILLILTIWTYVSVYAIVKWAGSAPDELNPVVLVMGVAGLVVLLVTLFAVGVGLMGRGMNPKKRARSSR